MFEYVERLFKKENGLALLFEVKNYLKTISRLKSQKKKKKKIQEKVSRIHFRKKIMSWYLFSKWNGG